MVIAPGVGNFGGLLIRWFADPPIERKLRVVITAPAMAAFAIAMVMHVATSLLHVREELQLCATRIAGVTGVSVVQAVQNGDVKAATAALNALRDEPLVSVAEVYLPDGRKVATYSRGRSVAGAPVEPIVAVNSKPGSQALPDFDPQRP